MLKIYNNSYHLTIDELFDKGLEHSIAIQSSLVKNQIVTDRTSLAKNKQLPEIGLSASFGYAGTPVILNTNLSFRQRINNPDWKQNYQVNISQPIYTGGKIKGNIEKKRIGTTDCRFISIER